MHIVEVWGTEISRIINRCKEYDLPVPAFEEFGDGFKVTLFRKAVEATDTFINNIRMVYEHCNVDTPFGQSNVMEWLEYSKSKATNIMNALKTAEIIEKVKGFGPGRYRFVDLQD